MKILSLDVKLSICIFLNTSLGGKRKQLTEEFIQILDKIAFILLNILDRESEEKYQKAIVGSFVTIYAQSRNEYILEKLCVHENSRNICDAYLLVINRPGGN